MVTREQFMNGLVQYVDNEIMPLLSTAGKWGFGTLVVLASCKGETLLNSVMSNDVVKMLDVVTSDGLIDVDVLADALMKSAARYGRLQLNVPMIGTMTFSEVDVQKIKTYINGGA